MKVTVVLFVIGGVAAWANTAPKASFPCRIVDYRVASANDLRVMCGIRPEQSISYPVQIGELNDKGEPVAGTTQNGEFDLDRRRERQWAKVTLSSPLIPGKNYRLSTLPHYLIGGKDLEFETQDFDFGTKPQVSVVMPTGDSPAAFKNKEGRLRFVLTSKVAIDPASLGQGKLSEDPPLSRPMDAQFQTSLEAYPTDEPSSDEIGLAFIWVTPPGVKSLDTHLTVRGLRNILGAELKVPDKQRLKLAGAPKDKAGSDLYFQLLSQVGPGSKPGWAVDLKFSPQLANLGKGFFFSPLALAESWLGHRPRHEDDRYDSTRSWGDQTAFHQLGKSARYPDNYACCFRD